MYFYITAYDCKWKKWFHPILLDVFNTTFKTWYCQIYPQLKENYAKPTQSVQKCNKLNNIIYGNKCHRYYPTEINHNVILDYATLLQEVTI